MVDVSTVWDVSNIQGDWVVSGGALQSTDDLQTAVLISLFTDRVAQANDVIPDGTTDPRGWWGDIQPSGNVIPIGSRLWLLSREKQTQQTLNRAKNYAQEALQWLLDDGVAVQIDIQVSWQQRSFLAMVVTIYRSNGTNAALNFQFAWEQI